jgi:hypothetical protein
MDYQRTPAQEEAEEEAYLSEVELQRQESQRQVDAANAAGRSPLADAEDLHRFVEAATARPDPLATAATEPLEEMVLSYEEARDAGLIGTGWHAGRLYYLADTLDQAAAEPLGLSLSQRQILRRTAQRLRSWADADTTPFPTAAMRAARERIQRKAAK